MYLNDRVAVNISQNQALHSTLILTYTFRNSIIKFVVDMCKPNDAACVIENIWIDEERLEAD